jgi:hypothetical protein
MVPKAGKSSWQLFWFGSATKLLPRLRRVKLRHENHEWQFRRFALDRINKFTRQWRSTPQFLI